MPPRAFAVTLPIALAAWLVSFSAGCSGTDETPKSDMAPAAAAPADAVGIRYVTHRVHAATDFKRISEYFTGEENHGGDVVMYSDSSDRRGLYFMIAIDRFGKLPDGAIAVMEYVTAEKAEPQKCLYVIPRLDDVGLFREFRLGITGEDWPTSNPKVVAWKITLHQRKPGLMIPPGTTVKVGAKRASESLAKVTAERGATILAGLGEPIASARSFLWALPAKPAVAK